MTLIPSRGHAARWKRPEVRTARCYIADRETTMKAIAQGRYGTPEARRSSPDADSLQGVPSTQNIRVLLSTLWVFMLFNYLYCDVMTLFDPSVTADLSREALLAASFLMEIPIAMALLSRVLKYRSNRWANVIAGVFLIVVQVSTLFVGSGPTVYYAFFSVIEVACLLFIVWRAWSWAEPARAETVQAIV